MKDSHFPSDVNRVQAWEWGKEEAQSLNSLFLPNGLTFLQKKSDLLIPKGELTGKNLEELKRLVFNTQEEADRREVLQAHKIMIIFIKHPLF